MSWIEKHSQNAIMAALVASALAFAGSVASVVMTYHYGTVSQDRQAKIEQISKFDAAGSQLVEAAGLFINSINAQQDLGPAKLKVRTVVANQIQETEILRNLFGNDLKTTIDEYQSALSEFNQTASRTNDVTAMRPWAESFGRVLDTKSSLSKALSKRLGIS
jgi:hypothetical protein